MAKHIISLCPAPISSYFLPRGDTLLYCLALISIVSLLGQELSRCSALSHDFEGFGDDSDEDEQLTDSLDSSDLPFRSSSPPPTITKSDFETDRGPPSDPPSAESPPSDPSPKPSSSSSFDYWDEDEFEGLPVADPSPDKTTDSAAAESATDSPADSSQSEKPSRRSLRSFTVEIICVSFLIAFIFNYLSGKRENEGIALAWAVKFATRDSIFEKNFSLLGTGDGKDTPLLLKEGQDVFKFYASGRRFCQGLLATMELRSRHDLISRIYNLVVPCKDTITFEVFMNDDAMDQVVFALAKKKAAKVMHKEVRDLQKYGNLVTPPSNRKWVAEDLAVISESKEVAGELITEAVLDQVFGDKAFEKYGKGFISMHFSDQHPSGHRKMLLFKFVLPDANNMADMTRLVALIPYYIDLVGRYKLSPQARSKTDSARSKAAQEAYKELQLARQEALQKRKAEKRKVMEETEAKLSAEIIRKKEEKERARQQKKAMPKVKMTRAR
ncbi:hypothetical protein MRB53_004766 [Persea americana]|uniref:Uncharacterized protein n=1 Tax=Persea americana TaxID=3435 RepID=A0ACC2MC66_PERAE|nr:hypothetical protein MRB53_004766 [Persea americana]|eukprot:TRINITY_DN2091_c0_g1_i1.p1 TRINITY_DN2091_c0_g1~~TRINITY_DN2091_c0_g1_i1.p1  ORF type:complete len:534 (-),score=82.47 TRINITY_DN2091_c0_g1_i1:340-1833(-)